ncbi:MAG: IS4 family transposase [Candidatus Eisenbacteria bacterium]|nr:IS4 family transposase [Candidatus Eisenbacteria bacterium]
MQQATTLFLQIVRQMPNSLIQNAIDTFGSDLQSRRLHGRHHLFVLLLGHLRGVSSLRHLVELWDGIPGVRAALGMNPIARSTLADANRKRGHQFFRALMAQILNAAHQAAHRYPRKLKRLSYALDSTSIELCADLFEWARVSEDRSAIKLHTVLRTGVALPEMIVVSDGASHDVKVAKRMTLPSNAIISIDRAYVDAQFLADLHDRETTFVTRLKRKMKYRVSERRSVPRSALGVTSDQEIVLTGAGAEVYGNRPLRRVRYRDPESGAVLEFLTNDLRLAARTIALLYKERWEVELFFKWMKQNIKVLHFWGRSKNAILTQLWVALLAYALVAWIHLKLRSDWTRLRTWRFVQDHLLLPVGAWFWEPEAQAPK